MRLVARKEQARKSKNYEVAPYYTIRSSNLTTRSIINLINFLPIDFIFSLHAFPPPVYYTGGENACKKRSIGRKLIKLWNLKEVSVREAFCKKKVVEKLSELEETFG